MSDIMDEFEFKPITEGLGFQKKNNESPAKEGLSQTLSAQFTEGFNSDFAERTSERASDKIPDRPAVKMAISNSLNAFNQFNDLNTKAGMDAAIAHLEKGGTFGKSKVPELKAAPSLTKNVAPSTTLSTPLPRTENKNTAGLQAKKQNTSNDVPTTSVDEILKTLQDKKMPGIANNATRTRIDATPEPVKYKKTAWDFAAFMLDVMLVVASNLMCLIILMFTTHVDLFSNIFNPDSAGMIYKSLAALVLGTTWIYLVANRVFLGCTPGEWVFDQRIGFPKDTGTAMYSLKIVLRATLTVITGLVLFPLASALLNEDILGTWMDLQMLKKA